MKLFHKIFLCFVVLFGIAFQIAGYLLINFVYETSIGQEKKFAFQEFQHNKYILQSILYLKPELFESEEGNISGLSANFTAPISLYGEDGDCIFSNMAVQPENSYFEKKEDGKIAFQMFKKDGKSYILVYDYVVQGEAKINLVTETDISSIVNVQKDIITYFQKIYLIILCISFPVVFLLTKALTSSIKKVKKAAKRIATGHYSERISVNKEDEIGVLASDFNQMAEQIEEKIAKLSDVARQKEDFVGNFAHELKTPLTSVIGYADMLYQRELPREQVKSAAEYILNEGMRLESLSLKLMDLFVLDKQDFLLERMEVKEIFENMEQGMKPVCEKYKIRLHIDIENGNIEVDYDLFKTMILNLVDNARKADCKDIWITGKLDGNRYQIKIEDNGQGIPPDELERITEAFYMVDKSRSRKQHGAGLGMTLVSKIVEIHKSKMKIESDGRTRTVISIMFHLLEGGQNE